ncbi:hypothetical protein FSP39_013982 [Pinctada imbricata]|uniref:Transmembrane protein 115 n=1 Tax=Pinctada imbricata TaxID=66713 RepID=A0AA89CAS6_PINIB|nr:hypothetical protein FSP39_013982 [Pinctada imbricata]
MPMMKNLQQQASIAVGNSSVVVKTVAVLLVFGYFLTFIHSITDHITVTPGHFAWVWTYASHSFIELHFWDVIIDIAVIILCGKLLEPLWGAMDMLIFYVVVTTFVAIATQFLYLSLYMVTKNVEYLFDTHICGQAGFIAGFSVAVKQVMPDHVLLASPFGKLRNTHIPLLLLIVAITLRLCQLLEGPYPFMFGFGILISWIYLRFYQKHGNGNRGDMGDNFSFASFFPSQLQPIISILSNTIFLALVKVKICKKPQRKYDISSSSTIQITLPGTDPQDAERRRQVALKALNERLSKSDQGPKWPSLDDEEASKSSESSGADAKKVEGKSKYRICSVTNPRLQRKQERTRGEQNTRFMINVMFIQCVEYVNLF